MLILEKTINDVTIKVTYKNEEYQVSKSINGNTAFINTKDKSRAIELCSEFINNAKGV